MRARRSSTSTGRRWCRRTSWTSRTTAGSSTSPHSTSITKSRTQVSILLHQVKGNKWGKTVTLGHRKRKWGTKQVISRHTRFSGAMTSRQSRFSGTMKSRQSRSMTVIDLLWGVPCVWGEVSVCVCEGGG